MINPSLVTAKSGSIVSESFKQSYATVAGAITPSTLTAMVGISNGSALQLPPAVSGAMGKLSAHVGFTANSVGYISGISGPTGSASRALANLTTLQSQIMPSGNHAAFGQILNQAHGHIGDAAEIKKATSFISNTSFGDFGSGITNMAGLTTQGLDGSLGNLSSAAAAMTAAGPVYGVGDMSKFGTDTGFINNLASQKMANASGLNAALIKAGVDPTDTANPAYASKVSSVMGSITDSKIIAAVAKQLGIPSVAQGMQSLKDFTNLSKLSPAGAVAGLTAGLSGLGDKFSDMAASFKNPAAASTMLTKIAVPSVPNLNSFAPSLNGLMTSLAPNINSMTGLAHGASALSGTNGLPNVTDFTHAVSGGPELNAIHSGNVLTSAQISALEDSITKSRGLMSNAGIDLTSASPPSLGSSMSFATNLHKFGADTSGAGTADILKNMATPNSPYGDAITASLAEGKNKALMQANGIRALDFSGGPTNPFTG